MTKTLKKIINDLVVVFINYVIAYIPCWSIRRLFYLATGMKIGKKTRINQRVFVYAPWRIEIGHHTIINSFTILDGRGGLKIGSNTSVSMHTTIYTASHETNSDEFEYYKEFVDIGNCCWICVNTVVLPGSNVADGVVIGANSVYKGNSITKGIYVGSPAKMVKKRKLDTYYTLDVNEFFT